MSRAGSFRRALLPFSPSGENMDGRALVKVPRRARYFLSLRLRKALFLKSSVSPNFFFSKSFYSTYIPALVLDLGSSRRSSDSDFSRISLSLLFMRARRLIRRWRGGLPLPVLFGLKLTEPLVSEMTSDRYTLLWSSLSRNLSTAELAIWSSIGVFDYYINSVI